MSGMLLGFGRFMKRIASVCVVSPADESEFTTAAEKQWLERANIFFDNDESEDWSFLRIFSPPPEDLSEYDTAGQPE